MELTNLQKQKVDEVVKFFNFSKKTTVVFSAPTASGKTFMAINIISSLISENINEKLLFIVATPSSADLPKQLKSKFEDYKKFLPWTKFEIEYVQSPSTKKAKKDERTIKIVPERNKVYIFGKSSFGKGRILTEQDCFKDLIQRAIDENYNIVYIRDEAHSGGNVNIDKENFESIIDKNANFIVKMTATPKQDRNTLSKWVILTEQELKNEGEATGKFLIKTELDSMEHCDNRLEDEKLLDNAILKFKEIKNDYATLNQKINPAMLLQINNSSADIIKEAEFKKELKMIKEKLTNARLSWVQYFDNGDKDYSNVDNKNFTLDSLSKNTNTTDVIIFKIGPSMGWDIPRACMLVQLRNVSSQTLDQQTIGRIKRNPLSGLIRNAITDKYYIFSNATINPIENNFKIIQYKVKDKFINEELVKIEISKINESQQVKKEVQSVILNFLEKQHKDGQIIQQINTLFKKNAKGYFEFWSNEKTTPIDDVFIFLIEYKKCIANMPEIETIKEFYDKHIKQHNILEEFYLTTIAKKFQSAINNEINKVRNASVEYKFEKKQYEPKNYNEFYCNEIKHKPVTNREYLFNPPQEQPIGFDPENTVFNTLRNWIENYDDAKVKLWAKNLVHSNIYGEYLDEFKNIQKSYFDFILKFSNGNILYIEVKGENDINEDKTTLLKNAYCSYFENKTTQLSIFDPKLVVCVWHANKESIKKIYTYYDKAKIKDNLEQKTYSQLLEYLSKN